MSDQNKLERDASEEEPGQGETTQEAGASRKDDDGKGSGQEGSSGRKGSGSSRD